jgi:hypothetical protein
MHEKYHIVVTVGYSFVIAVIVSVLRMRLAEHLALWLIGVILFATVLYRIRKGAEAPEHYEIHS